MNRNQLKLGDVVYLNGNYNTQLVVTRIWKWGVEGPNESGIVLDVFWLNTKLKAQWIKGIPIECFRLESKE